MMRPWVWVFSFLVVSPPLLPLPVQSQVPDAVVRRLMSEFSVPGLALAVVEGDSVALYGWGRATAAEGGPEVTPDTPFRLASAAKVLVAATVLTEAQAGRVDLHADVAPLVGFELTGEFPGPITLHDLLTHTAGFDERLVGYAAPSSEGMRTLAEYLPDRMPERGWPASELISYSNHGMSLAAYAVERAAGRSFADVAESNLFRPLGMASTAFLTQGVSIPPDAAHPLSCDGSECSPVAHIYSHAYPAGLAFSTARDMGGFVQAMLASDSANGGLGALIPQRFTHDVRIPGMSYGFFNQRYGGRRVLAHSGSVPGFWSLLLIMPEEKVGFFFATNGGDPGFGPALRDRLLMELVEEAPSLPLSPRRTENPSDRAGSYELTRYSHQTIERLPQLFNNTIRVAARGDTLLVFAGGPADRFLQIGDSLYRQVGGEESLAFGMRRGRAHMFRSSDVFGAWLPAAYERRGRFQGSYFLNEYISWLLGVPVIVMVLIWPVSVFGSAVLRSRRGQEGGGRDPLRIGATVGAAAATVLFAWFAFGFIARSIQLFQTGEMMFGMPDSLSRLLWIPWVHLGLSGLLTLGLPVVWKKRWWGFPRRMLFSMIVGALLLQLVFLLNWNYLPASW